MIAFGRACAAIAATASKLEKVALVAEYLCALDDADLAPAARFFTGNPFAHSDQRSLGLGGRMLVAAAHVAPRFSTRSIEVLALPIARAYIERAEPKKGTPQPRLARLRLAPAPRGHQRRISRIKPANGALLTPWVECSRFRDDDNKQSQPLARLP
jgi:hypothetical protein